MNWDRLRHDLRQLSYTYTVAVDDDYRSIIVKDFKLPPGYNYSVIPILLILPDRYPEQPLGVGKAKAYVPNDLRYRGRKPGDFHTWDTPKGWAWWCYEWIEWNPRKDNFITFFEMLRAHMTSPR